MFLNNLNSGTRLLTKSLFEEDILKSVPNPKKSLKKISTTQKPTISRTSLSPSSSSSTSRSSSSSYNSIELSNRSTKFKSLRFHKSLGANINKIHDAAQGGTCNKKAKNVCEKGDLIKKNNESLEKYFLKFNRSSKISSVNDDLKAIELNKCESPIRMPLKIIGDERKQTFSNSKFKSETAAKLISNEEANICKKKDLTVELDQKINPDLLNSKFSKLNFSPKFDLKYYSTHSSLTSDDG